MIRIGHNKELILTLPRLNKNGKNSGYYSIVCFGRKRHYRKDGSCVHTEGLMKIVKPKFRKRTRIDPFGGKVPDPVTEG